MSDRISAVQSGQAAYEAYYRAAGMSVLPWFRVGEAEQRNWAAAEQAVLGLETLPLTEHEQVAEAILANGAAPDALTHAVLGLAELIRTVIANAG